MSESLRTIEGEIDEIKNRISSSGDSVVELHINAASGKERVTAFAEKADALINLHNKMKDLAKKNGAAHIRDLKVKIEITGLVKQASNNELIVVGLKISGS